MNLILLNIVFYFDFANGGKNYLKATRQTITSFVHIYIYIYIQESNLDSLIFT